MGWSTDPEHERFEIRRRLGGGALGEVFEAFDRHRAELIALKTVRVSAASLAGLEKEWPALAGISHPNLVALYDLVMEGEQAFFTMELVAGRSLHDDVRADGQELDGERLRAALLQIASGLKAIHDAGRMHRDLKPSNILITERGRAVLLDFGITDLNPALRTRNVGLAGSAAYLSPEQARGEAPQPAGDWYALGVILFEILTGRWPFTGSLARILIDKQFIGAPSPADFAAALPADLVDLCRSLLETDPAIRPGGTEVIRRLGGTEAVEKLVSPSEVPGQTAFVGREAHLEVLVEAADRAGNNDAAVVYVHGRQGFGKTTLIHSFLGRLRATSRVVVLTGRCYQIEAAPYKAWGSVVESLGRFLKTLSPKLARELLPERIDALTRLFPSLLQVEAVVAVVETVRPQEKEPEHDQATLRRQAIFALRRLLDRMSALGTVVVCIDDLQWADRDSYSLLRELLLPPDPPPILLLASFDSEEVDARPFLQELLAQTGTGRYRSLAVRALSEESSRSLAEAYLGEKASDESLVKKVCLRADGSPFLMEQITRHITDGADLTQEWTLRDMLRQRLRSLPRSASAALRVMTVAERPLPWSVVLQAAGQPGEELMPLLKSALLMKSTGQEDVEIYHACLRDELQAAMSEKEAAQVHGRLAAVFEDIAGDPPESLREHYRKAGDQAKAGRLAKQAAARAASALAFERASDLYREALELPTLDDAERTELLHGLADTLGFAGRTREAAELHVELAERTEGRRALDYRRHAAMEYLMSGYVEEGLQQAQQVLRAVGIEVAEGEFARRSSLLWHRFHLWLRGMRFRRRSAAQIPARRLLRIDTCWAMAAGLEMADAFRASEFQNRHLLLALEAGEPRRIARAMAMEVRLLADAGSAARRQAARMRRRAYELSQELEDDYAAALATLQDGVALSLAGEWRTAMETCDRAEQMFHECREGATWEITTAQRVALTALAAMGSLAEVGRRLPQQLKEFLDRGNVYGTNELRTRLNIHWLAADDPVAARHQIDEAEASWDDQGFHLFHVSILMARVQADLYTGHGVDALAAIEEALPRIKSTMLPKIQRVRVEMANLLAQSALAAAIQIRERRGELLGTAEQQARVLERESVGYARPLATLIRGSVAHLRDNDPMAREALEYAAQSFENVEMKLHSTAAWRRLGELMGGAAGQELINRSNATMKYERIRDPAAMTTMLIPGIRV